jgi:dTDP-4-dehydrorhamnose reductase
MRILLFGREGQLGWELHRCVSPLGELLAIDKDEVDLNLQDPLVQLIRRYRPDVILNPAAYTAVDQAESDFEVAHAVNGVAPGIMADEAKSLGCLLIHYSTDYVFDGEKGAQYSEEDIPNPINTYGKTKLEGENAIRAIDGGYLILRTSWVYSMRMPSFPTKVLEWARKQKVMRIVDDQVGSPTWGRMLAGITSLLLGRGGKDPLNYYRELNGVYHVAGLGVASRYEWAQAIIQNDLHVEEQVVQKLNAARSVEFETAAKRPRFSALDCTLFQDVFNLRIPDWKETLKLAMSEMS